MSSHVNFGSRHRQGNSQDPRLRRLGILVDPLRHGDTLPRGTRSAVPRCPTSRADGSTLPAPACRASPSGTRSNYRVPPPGKQRTPMSDTTLVGVRGPPTTARSPFRATVPRSRPQSPHTGPPRGDVRSPTYLGCGTGVSTGPVRDPTPHPPSCTVRRCTHTPESLRPDPVVRTGNGSGVGLRSGETRPVTPVRLVSQSSGVLEIPVRLRGPQSDSFPEQDSSVFHTRTPPRPTPSMVQRARRCLGCECRVHCEPRLDLPRVPPSSQ